MNPGYLYILQNKSFGNNLIKIGMTTREPDIRAGELSRASGIPEKFHISYACQVADCSLAEKEVHHILQSYRSNKKREFFVIAVEIAKRIIVDTCREINGCDLNSIQLKGDRKPILVELIPELIPTSRC